MNEKLKIEYTIVSRGTEKYGNNGYMGVTEPNKGNRYFVVANHYQKFSRLFKRGIPF